MGSMHTNRSVLRAIKSSLAVVKCPLMSMPMVRATWAILGLAAFPVSVSKPIEAVGKARQYRKAYSAAGLRHTLPLHTHTTPSSSPATLHTALYPHVPSRQDAP